jgi:hypothetical protein
MARVASAPSSVLDMLKTVFVKDFGRKVVALVLAIGLWFLISKIVRVEITRDVHVNILTSQVDRDLAKSDPSSLMVDVPGELVVQEPKDYHTKGSIPARVVVSGPRTLLEVEGGMQISALYVIPPNYCDTTSPRPFFIDSSAILINGFRPKQGVSVEIPEVPTIVLARREKRRVRIDLRNFSVVGRPREGWELEEKTKADHVRPEVTEVEISGPASEVLPLESDPAKLRFQPLDISRGDSTMSLTVGLDRTQHPLLTLDDPPNRIKVEVVLSEVREERTIGNVRIVPLFLDELIESKPRLRDLPAADSPIQPPLGDDKWKASVVLSAPRTFWTSHDPEDLRDRIHLWVNLRQMIASEVRIKSLTVESCGMRGSQNEAWPNEVQFKKVNPDLISVTLHE